MRGIVPLCYVLRERIHKDKDESIDPVSQAWPHRRLRSEVRRRCLVCQSERLCRVLVIYLVGKHEKPKVAV